MFSSGCRRGILALAAGGGFNPLTLFAAGEQGVWFDPADFSSMFQDSAGTTPVTATGQQVGKILDKSGRGNHATQATAAARPTLQVDAAGFYYLATDGVDDCMVTPAIDFSATDKMTVLAGINKQSDVGGQIIVESSASVVINAGTFALIAPGSATYEFDANGATRVAATIGATYAAPDASVLTMAVDFAAAANAQVTARRNGVQQTMTITSGTVTGVGPFGNFVINLFRRNGVSNSFSGRCYGLIVRGRTTAVADLALAERFIGSRMGIPL